LRVAYQGEPGAFSEDAATRLVPGCEPIACATFDEAFSAAAYGIVDGALLPVENSISGAVPRPYDLLWSEPELTIHDEIVYRVVQNLIALPTATTDDLREVRSHPVALEQCRAFLARYPGMHPKVVADTAGAVREIVENGDPSVGAIGSALAAARYGARVLVPAVQDVRDNFTRFFLIRRGPSERPDARHACIALVLEHRPGALRDALGTFADAGLNLRTLASRPSLNEPFTYRFYLEIERVEPEKLAVALAGIQGTARVLGLY